MPLGLARCEVRIARMRRAHTRQSRTKMVVTASRSSGREGVHPIFFHLKVTDIYALKVLPFLSFTRVLFWSFVRQRLPTSSQIVTDSKKKMSPNVFVINPRDDIRSANDW